MTFPRRVFLVMRWDPEEVADNCKPCCLYGPFEDEASARTWMKRWKDSASMAEARAALREELFRYLDGKYGPVSGANAQARHDDPANQVYLAEHAGKDIWSKAWFWSVIEVSQEYLAVAEGHPGWRRV